MRKTIIFLAITLLNQIHTPNIVVTSNNENTLYIGVDNTIKIDKGSVRSAMLVLSPIGCGMSIQGALMTRIVRVTKLGRAQIRISGGSNTKQYTFDFTVKYPPK